MLVSFAGREDESPSSSETLPRRVYAILSLKHLPGTFQILKVQAVPYQSVRSIQLVSSRSRAHYYQTSSSGAPIHPRVQSVVLEKLLAVQFGDAVTICAQGEPDNPTEVIIWRLLTLGQRMNTWIVLNSSRLPTVP